MAAIWSRRRFEWSQKAFRPSMYHSRQFAPPAGRLFAPNLLRLFTVVVFESLKKRRKGVYRAVPVPPELLDALDLVHGIREAQRRGHAKARLRSALAPIVA